MGLENIVGRIFGTEVPGGMTIQCQNGCGATAHIAVTLVYQCLEIDGVLAPEGPVTREVIFGAPNWRGGDLLCQHVGP